MSAVALSLSVSFQHQKSNMADAAAARREARRRKILENSHNRLQIISGKSSDECTRESTIRTVIPEPENDFPEGVSTNSHSSSSSLQNGVLFNQQELIQLLTGTHDIDASGSGDSGVASDLASLLPPQGLVPPSAEPAETTSISVWEKIVTYKYDIVLLSLFLQILYGLSLLTYESGYFFLPVIVYIVTKLIWFPTQSSSGIANLLMLLNGMTPARVQKILFFAQLFGVITRDIFVYIFTTIFVQSLWFMLKGSVIT